MARWVGLVLLMAGLWVAAGAHKQRGRPHTEQRTYYCGYGIVLHKFTTSDGYILQAFRLNLNASGREPVLLQHGLATNGNSWFKLGRNSLPCVLAREGYDVWVGNTRGTYYSRKHTERPIIFPSFWGFTLHEIAVGDLPATIDYILQKTGKSKLSYVGDGVGASLVFIMLSELRSYNAKVRVAVSFAPVCYTNPNFFVRWTAYNIFMAKVLLDIYRVALEILKILKTLVLRMEAEIDDSIQWDQANKPMSEDDKFLLEGMKTLSYFVNKNRTRSLLSYHLDLTSIKALFHYCQVVFSGSFAKAHVGIFANWDVYGRPDPPRYRFQLKHIKTPQFIIYSDDDAIVKGKGVGYLIEYMPKNVGKSHKFRKDEFGHNDFLYSRHAKQYVYDYVVRELNRYRPPPPPPPTTTTTTTVNPECLVCK